jgi:hypothetical protein
MKEATKANESKNNTYRMTNFRGAIETTKKLMTKQAKAAKLQPPKTSKRSHLLTAENSNG